MCSALRVGLMQSLVWCNLRRHRTGYWKQQLHLNVAGARLARDVSRPHGAGVVGLASEAERARVTLLALLLGIVASEAHVWLWTCRSKPA